MLFHKPDKIEFKTASRSVVLRKTLFEESWLGVIIVKIK